MSSEATEDETTTLVLLAPIALGASSWDAVPLDGLEHYRYEYPGHGSRAPLDAEWDLDWLADDVAERVEGPLELVGVSMGSMVAQHLAVRHPDRVRSAMLVAGGAATDPAIMNARAERILEAGPRAVVEETLQRWFTERALADRANPVVSVTRATLDGVDARSVATAWRAMGRHDLTTELAQVRAAVTCVAASGDKSTPVAAMVTLSKAIPDARLEIVEGPHLTHLEYPEQFARTLRDHLDRTRRHRIGVAG